MNDSLHRRCRFVGIVVFGVVLQFLAACASTTKQNEPISTRLNIKWPGHELTQKPHAGLKLRDDVKLGLPLVSWIYPGPLEGTGMSSRYLNRGDTVLSVNDQQINAAQFDELVKQSKPGDVLVMKVKRTGSPKVTSVPKASDDGAIEVVELKLAPMSDWNGPLAFNNPNRVTSPVLSTLKSPEAFSELVTPWLTSHQLAEPFKRLSRLMRKSQEEANGFHALSVVNEGFHHPLRVVALQKAVTHPLDGVVKNPQAILSHGADLLDITRPELGSATIGSDLSASLQDQYAQAQALLNTAFARVGSNWAHALPKSYEKFLVENAEKGVPSDHEDPRASIVALQASMRVDYATLLQAAAVFANWFGKDGDLPDMADAGEQTPEQRRSGAVEGTVHDMIQVNGRWIVIGGLDDNTYDMSKVDIVIDTGGDDTYRYPDNQQMRQQRVGLIVDMQGDDRYESEFGGPAGALAGVNIVVDREGDDSYESVNFGCGAGVLGVGLLIDHAGNDVYNGETWSQGVGFYGLGAILDLGSGSDVYKAHTNSQGVGGPRGVGIIVEQTGNEVYVARHPESSAYGLPATFYSMSQGVGIGVRGFDTGGIGVIHDMNGRDEYLAGEFSQGQSYFWGLGILHDRAGNDQYSGNRYSQGVGCHQGIGVLADDRGNDTYHGAVAAHQGGAWDIAMGVLIDRQGNDTYKAAHIGQGGAAQQAIGILIDLEGTDHYVARAQGTSTGNKYHYHRSGGVRSMSLLIDAGGQQDFYSPEHPNNTTATTGKENEKTPEHARLHGLIVDLPASEKIKID